MSALAPAPVLAPPCPRITGPSPLLRARVLGGGPTGALAALALAQAGWRVQLVDPLSGVQLQARRRAYALSHSSRLFLRRLGLWSQLAEAAVPFRSLGLCDLEAGRAIGFGPVDVGFGTGRCDHGAAVGWILQHQPLMQRLLEHLEAHPGISLSLGETPPPLPDSLDPPDLVVAADGSASPTREAAGISRWSRPYGQGCLTAQVRLRGSAPDRAWELFRRQGPFAVLPLGDGAAQLVWSAPAEHLRRLEGLDPVAFLDALAAALPDSLQPEALLDTPRAFPVALELACRFHRGSLALVGEAAHRCHPVGGQGMNLCWRDVEELQRQALRAAAGQLSPAAVAGAYGHRRWPDVLLTLLSTDLLVRIFSNRQPLLLKVRRLALGLMRRSGALRHLSLKAMTLGPCRLAARWSE
ncbi:FAD-dependent monooxygenase [Synechococcus sp. CBW1107]|uniref:FAD-dependent monooxygenase n=1 Tax=Synechococcus sp. CBW1107 TaxID=2789857 RepID=UPI0018CED402|nr:FAD-dependent monooxygenase [Synechococcus sp. CBW1107]QPN57266.1 FAD-dependent monooxygenase [Synechococcus sp. CBW1107]CAK6693356.1 3-demethoxyubiquinol 3-hydroxylase [Synechococcus sp. CBW1107]